MAANRIAKSSVNWKLMSELCPASQKTNLAVFKAKVDGHLRRVLANPETLPKIDWEAYKKKVPVAGMVDEFKKQYEAVKIEYPKNTLSAKIEAIEQETKADIQKYIAESSSRISSLKEEIRKIETTLPLDQMTLEEFRDAYPDQAIDPINRPTFWPHDPEDQPGAVEKSEHGVVDAKAH